MKLHELLRGGSARGRQEDQNQNANTFVVVSVLAILLVAAAVLLWAVSGDSEAEKEGSSESASSASSSARSPQRAKQKQRQAARGAAAGIRGRDAGRKPTDEESATSSEGGTDTSRTARSAGAAADCPMYESDKEQLALDMGISGLAVSSKLADMNVVVPIAFQSFCLQAMILYYIVKRCLILKVYKSNRVPGGNEPLPEILVEAAIYIHVINCVRDLPLSAMILRHWHTVHELMMERLVYGVIFSIDGILIPLAQLVIGALFLCTSGTVADLIMNSCAVAYIASIDNMILEVHRMLNKLAFLEKDYGDPIRLPVPVQTLKAINWTFCVVPLFPLAFSVATRHIGLEVLHL